LKKKVLTTALAWHLYVVDAAGSGQTLQTQWAVISSTPEMISLLSPLSAIDCILSRSVGI
jgi:hypothetical protein